MVGSAEIKLSANDSQNMSDVLSKASFRSEKEYFLWTCASSVRSSYVRLLAFGGANGHWWARGVQ